MNLFFKLLIKMKEFICKLIGKSEDVPDSEEVKASKLEEKSNFGVVKIWAFVMLVYILIFGYIGYIAFWPMSFNDPEQNIEKYFSIIQKYSDVMSDNQNEDVLKTTINDLVKKAEESANDIQQLASQSFNIVLGAFLAFLSATVTTIFQGRRK